MHRLAIVILTACLLAVSTTSFASNESITIVLHARDGLEQCNDPQQQGMDCINGRPNLDLTGIQVPCVYIMLRNYDNVLGVQCAFDWPATWTLLISDWACLPGSKDPVKIPTAPGDSVILPFNCISGGGLVTMGRMVFGPPAGGGCFSVIESDYPYGNHTVDCKLGLTSIDPANVGRVCVGAGGYDACDPAATPVENTTWGKIKTQYR